MPYKNEWSKSQVIRNFDGRLTGEDYVRSLQEICGDERFDTMKALITDFSRVSDVALDDSSVTDAAALAIGVFFAKQRLKVGFVIPEGEVGKQLRDVLTMELVQNYQHHLFSSLAQAREWASRLY